MRQVNRRGGGGGCDWQRKQRNSGVWSMGWDRERNSVVLTLSWVLNWELLQHNVQSMGVYSMWQGPDGKKCTAFGNCSFILELSDVASEEIKVKTENRGQILKWPTEFFDYLSPHVTGMNGRSGSPKPLPTRSQILSDNGIRHEQNQVLESIINGVFWDIILGFRFLFEVPSACWTRSVFRRLD